MSKDWIQLPDGERFYPMKARGPIRTRHIAGALSKIARYTGHSKYPMWVSQHSVNVARALPDNLKPWGLMHDASEAYMNDIARPVKRSFWLWGYRRAENRLLKRIAAEYNLVWPIPPAVHEADMRVLATEACWLFDKLDPEWAEWIGEIKPFYGDQWYSWLSPLSPKAAETEFLAHAEIYNLCN